MSKQLDRRFAAEAYAAFIASGGVVTVCPTGASSGAFNAAVSHQPMGKQGLEAK
jgi:hypothetical protein